jgi:hypothetical protein
MSAINMVFPHYFWIWIFMIKGSTRRLKQKIKSEIFSSVTAGGDNHVE